MSVDSSATTGRLSCKAASTSGDRDMRSVIVEFDIDDHNTLVQSPLLSRGGVAARSKIKMRSYRISRRRGGVAKKFIDHTTPSASARMLRGFFLVSRTPLLG